MNRVRNRCYRREQRLEQLHDRARINVRADLTPLAAMVLRPSLVVREVGSNCEARSIKRAQTTVYRLRALRMTERRLVSNED